MENKKGEVTKWEISKSVFCFFVMLLVFLANIPNGNNFSNMSTAMMVAKILSGLVLLFGTAFNGASVVYKLLSYFENRG